MLKFSASLLLLIFVCYFSIITATANVFFRRPSECRRQLPFAMAICRGQRITYCVKDINGRIYEVPKSTDCPPCGSHVKGFYIGKCQKENNTFYLF